MKNSHLKIDTDLQKLLIPSRPISLINSLEINKLRLIYYSKYCQNNPENARMLTK